MGGGPTIIDHQVIDLGPARSAAIVVSVEDLASRSHSLGAVERLELHAIVVPTFERSTYTVDFVSHNVDPGSVLHIQPGQVVRWPRDEGHQADVVLIPAVGADGDPFDRSAPCVIIEAGPSATAIAAVAADLRRQSSVAGDTAPLLAAAGRYLLRLVAAEGAALVQPGHQRTLLRAFLDELERSYYSTRSVSRYAGSIGTSAKTLSRATAALSGCSPKELIDRRVVLEARRLLAHTSYPSSAIGTMLGFSEPTNFTKFFLRHTGRSPQEFRLTVQ